MLVDYTPTEKYAFVRESNYFGKEPHIITKNDFYVKREDLACEWPGPPFAKVRGLYKGLLDMRARGVHEVGYYETSISMATWGVSYFCHLLNMKAVVFYYRYIDGLKYNQEKQQQIWKKFGAEVHINDRPNLQKIHESMSKKRFLDMYPNGEFLPAGLKFDYTIDEVTKQVHNVPDKALGGTVVICAGSGMMIAGVMNGLSERNISQDVIGVLCHSDKNKLNMKKFVISKSSLDPWHRIKLTIVDHGYDYTDREDCEVPFPCCPYYDRKAYKWMIDNFDKLRKPVLFWNIGSSYIYYDKEFLPEVRL